MCVYVRTFYESWLCFWHVDILGPCWPWGAASLRASYFLKMANPWSMSLHFGPESYQILPLALLLQAITRPPSPSQDNQRQPYTPKSAEITQASQS